MREIITHPDTWKAKNRLIDFKLKMQKISNDPFEKGFFNSLDIISWIESKIEDRSFAEIVRSAK